MPYQRAAMKSLVRIVKAEGRPSAVVKQIGFQGLSVGRLIRLGSEEEPHRFLLPFPARTLCSVFHGEGQDLLRAGRTEQCLSDGDRSVAVESNSRVPGQAVEGKFFRRGSGWPWISVVPSETTNYLGRVRKAVEAGKDGPGTEQNVRQLPLEAAIYPRTHHQAKAVGTLLNLLPVAVPVKICALLSKYGWTGHTLLELRTMMSEGTKLKPKHVLDVVNRQRDADVAYLFLEWALDEGKCTVHLSCFTVVLRLLGRVRKYDLMEKLLEDLDRRGYLMDKIILTAAMRCYAEGQRMHEALELFVKMKERGLQPDCITYSVLMQMFSKAKLYHEALNLYDEMLALGVATDTQAYNCVVSTLGKAGRLDLAYEKLAEMRAKGHIPDQYTYGVLLEGYAKAGRREFMDLYREMKSAGIPLNEVIFNIMFLGIEHIGTLSDAESLFVDMEQVGLSANLNAFSTLIAMCSKAGDAEGAQRWFDRMVRMSLRPTLAIGNSLLDSYARAKQFDRAKAVLDSFQTWDLVPNLPTLTVCLRCLSRCEEPEDFNTVRKMLSCHSGGQFLSVLAGSAPEKNLGPVIASFLKDLHLERRLIRRDFIDVVIGHLYRSGKRSQAYQVLEGALANYVFPALVEQGPEGICSVNLRGMERGTAIIALTYTLPRLAKQFHRKEMTPEWVQIYTMTGAEEIPVGNLPSVHQYVLALLKALHSPFRPNTLQTGGGFVCRGEEVMHWLDEPEIKSIMLAYKH